jgi:predicted MFS family arabinose efflux permease
MLITDSAYLKNILILALSMGAYFIPTVQVPFYYLGVLKMSPTKYALFSTIGPIICFTISLTLRKMLKSKGNGILLKVGIASILIGSIGLILTVKFIGHNPYYITFFLSIYSLLFPTIHPYIVSKVISKYPENNGSASSINYSFRSMAVWLGITIGSLTYNNSMISSSYYLLLITILIVILHYSNQKKSTI